MSDIYSEIKQEQENKKHPTNRCSACLFLQQLESTNRPAYEGLTRAVDDLSIKSPTLAAYVNDKLGGNVKYPVWAKHRRERHDPLG